MESLKSFLPFLIPIVIVELGLLGFTLWHIFTHKNYKYGNQILWVIIVIVGMQFIGPILYFIFGKEDS